MKKIKVKTSVWIAILVALVLMGAYSIKVAKNYPRQQNLDYRPGFFGVTFSKKFCSELGLDWKSVYTAVLNDLEVKEIRLPVYWDDIEREEGVFDFSDYDYIFSEGKKHNVNFIANVGWRLPRWPECHAPEWTNGENLSVIQDRAILMLKEVIERYKEDPNITAWQLENEPFFNAFGVCPPSDDEFFNRELELVRKLDDRPVIISATGELSFWTKEANLADIFGSTLYRVVWGPWTGYVRYPIPAWFYRLKARLAGVPRGKAVIIELQAEPWVPYGSMAYLPEQEARKSFNIEQFKANLQYAINVDFDKAYLWGVEWWYWQYQHENPDYWVLARALFK